MKDIYKKDPPKGKTSRKRKRRRGFTPYYTALLLIVLVVGAALSLMLFFKIDTFVVTGIAETQYTEADVVSATGLEIGQNLLTVSTDETEQRILDTLLYADAVTVKRKFPSTVIVTITPSSPAYNVSSGDSYYIASKYGRILDELSNPISGLPIIEGMELTSKKPFERLACEDSELPKILYKIGESLSKYPLEGVISINLSDKYNITMNYENRVVIELGTSSDIDYKLNYSAQILSEKVKPNEEGYLIIHDGNEASFVPKSDMDSYRKKLSESTPLQTETAETTVSETAVVTQ